MIKMNKKTTQNETVIGKLERLNKQMSELISIEKKANTDYDYVNANDLAELLGESINTIYARVHRKEIPYYKPGGKLLLFKVSEIRKWIEGGRHSTINEIKERI